MNRPLNRAALEALPLLQLLASLPESVKQFINNPNVTEQRFPDLGKAHRMRIHVYCERQGGFEHGSFNVPDGRVMVLRKMAPLPPAPAGTKNFVPKPAPAGLPPRVNGMTISPPKGEVPLLKHDEATALEAAMEDFFNQQRWPAPGANAAASNAAPPPSPSKAQSGLQANRSHIAFPSIHFKDSPPASSSQPDEVISSSPATQPLPDLSQPLLSQRSHASLLAGGSQSVPNLGLTAPVPPPRPKRRYSDLRYKIIRGLIREGWKLISASRIIDPTGWIRGIRLLICRAGVSTEVMKTSFQFFKHFGFGEGKEATKRLVEDNILDTAIVVAMYNASVDKLELPFLALEEIRSMANKISEEPCDIKILNGEQVYDVCLQALRTLEDHHGLVERRTRNKQNVWQITSTGQKVAAQLITLGKMHDSWAEKEESGEKIRQQSLLFAKQQMAKASTQAALNKAQTASTIPQPAPPSQELAEFPENGEVDMVLSTLQLEALKQTHNALHVGGKWTTEDGQTGAVVFLIDWREMGGDKHHIHRIVQSLRFAKLKFESRNLFVGDYLFVYRKRPMTPSDEELVFPYIFERKRMDDLAVAMTEHDRRRYESQKANMLRVKEMYPQTKLIYIIEGNYKFYGPKIVAQGVTVEMMREQVEEIRGWCDEVWEIKDLDQMIHKFEDLYKHLTSGVKQSRGPTSDLLAAYDEIFDRGNYRKRGADAYPWEIPALKRQKTTEVSVPNDSPQPSQVAATTSTNDRPLLQTERTQPLFGVSGGVPAVPRTLTPEKIEFLRRSSSDELVQIALSNSLTSEEDIAAEEQRQLQEAIQASLELSMDVIDDEEREEKEDKTSSLSSQGSQTILQRGLSGDVLELVSSAQSLFPTAPPPSQGSQGTGTVQASPPPTPAPTRSSTNESPDAVEKTPTRAKRAAKRAAPKRKAAPTTPSPTPVTSTPTHSYGTRSHSSIKSTTCPVCDETIRGDDKAIETHVVECIAAHETIIKQDPMDISPATARVKPDPYSTVTTSTTSAVLEPKEAQTEAKADPVAMKLEYDSDEVKFVASYIKTEPRMNGDVVDLTDA